MTLRNITIEPAKPYDLETLLKFEQGIIRTERPFDPTLAEDPITYYDIGKMIAADDAEVLVAKDAETIVASGYVKLKPAKAYEKFDYIAFMGFMWVEPEYRGQGINGQLLTKLEKWAKSKGLVEARLTVYSDNAPALNAYEKNEFKRHIIEMRKDLSIK